MRSSVAIALLILISSRLLGQNLDIETLKSINQNRNTGWDGTMQTLSNTYLGVAIAAPAAELIVAYTKNSKKHYHDAIQLACGFGATAITTTLFKYALQRDRPYVTYPGLNVYQTQSDPSMPSGHAAIAFSTAASLSMCYKKWYVSVPCYAWATGVAYSQMHLGMHYPTDVLVGALVGYGSSWVTQKTTRYLRHRTKEEQMLE
jgi:membrane-associated phospholipid phosphatase